MAELPSGITYGYVRGRYLLAIADTPSDPDRLPDSQAATGTVKFTPVTTALLSTATPPATVVPLPITVTLDSSGVIRDPAGAEGVWLVAGQYDVTFAVASVTLRSFRIEVTPAHTAEAPLDLTLAYPLTPSPATVFVVNEQIYLDTLAARDEAIAARDAAIAARDAAIAAAGG